jgi:hypothetical protein
MAVLVIVCLVFVVLIFIRARFIVQLIGQCPLCKRDTLYTTQICLACSFTRNHAHDLPQDRR